MKNKQIKFWIANLPYLFGLKKEYRDLKKDFSQEKFEQYVNKYIKKVMEAIGVEYKIHNKDNIIIEPALYIFNHNSMYDSYFSYPVTTRHSYFIAGEFEFSKKIPIIKNYMKWCNAIFVDRSSLKAGLKCIKEGTEQLKAGNNLCIFAEGELTGLVKEDESEIVGDFHGGSFKPAKNTCVPVIPVAIKGSEKVHTSSSMFGKINGGKVDVYIGKPIYDFKTNPQASTKEVASKTKMAIIDMLEKS